MVADVMTEIDRRDRPAGDYNRGHGKKAQLLCVYQILVEIRLVTR